MATSVQKLSDDQLHNRMCNIWNRIEKAFEGGTKFGIDWHTLWVCEPELAGKLKEVMDEAKRRKECPSVQ